MITVNAIEKQDMVRQHTEQSPREHSRARQPEAKHQHPEIQRAGQHNLNYQEAQQTDIGNQESQSSPDKHSNTNQQSVTQHTELRRSLRLQKGTQQTKQATANQPHVDQQKKQSSQTNQRDPNNEEDPDEEKYPTNNDTNNRQHAPSAQIIPNFAYSSWHPPDLHAIICHPAKLIPRIPFKIRNVFANAVSKCLRDIADDNNNKAWIKWTVFVRVVLWHPGRGGKKHTKAIINAITRRLKMWGQRAYKQLWEEFVECSNQISKSKNRQIPKSTSSNNKRYLRLAAIGDYSGAFNALSPNNTHSLPIIPKTTPPTLRNCPNTLTTSKGLQRGAMISSHLNTSLTCCHLRRRLKSLHAGEEHADAIKAEVGDNQFGVNTKSGIEMFTHGFKLIVKYVKANPGAVAVKIDIQNAFNTMKCSKMLELIRIKLPSVVPLCPGFLFQTCQALSPDGAIMNSKTGVYQWDPLAGALFAVSLADTTKLAFTGLDDLYFAAYHDDITIAAPNSASILIALVSLSNIKQTHGISINSSKSEWIADRDIVLPHPFNDIPHNHEFNTSIVNIPIGNDDHKSKFMEPHIQEWSRQFGALMDLRHSQTTMLLLRHSMHIFRVNYHIRINFVGNHQDWAKQYNSKIRECLESIMALPLNDIQKGGLRHPYSRFNSKCSVPSIVIYRRPSTENRA
ncbi:hypothetical protein RFI_29928 [Reticulomyxa filosa]|uniref:Reverse transcriptase domain-containing protein n=1 Tax=Reticulomyxa filosa TaxID=46433 RepID=X6LZX3_RETFI|nr:hypothetical protein RFI_29928 [Reticulomyxa filosa]|eukprot:ETO07463.1 hypothetical protein RFI_29928 [Reticulomyxa filosa]